MGIADSQELGCNGLSYLEKNAEKKNAFLHSPDDFLLQSQRSAPRRATDGPGWREGGCCVVLGEFRPVFNTPCVTVTRVTVGPGSCCAR